MHRFSANSDLVILGIPKSRKSESEILKDLHKYTDRLKVSLIVFANDEIDFRFN